MSERGARSVAVLAATGEWLTASRRRYQIRWIRARASSDFCCQRFAAYGHQCNGPAAVVTKTGSPDRIGLAEIVVEVDGIKERPSWVAGVLGRNGLDMVQSLPASRSYDQYPEAVRSGLVLQLLIQAYLPLPTIGVPVGADSLRAIVEFDEEIELLPITGV